MAGKEDTTKDKSTLVAILQVVVPVIGTIAAAYIGYLGIIEPIREERKAIQTAEARGAIQTAEARAAIVIPTPTPPEELTPADTPVPPTDDKPPTVDISLSPSTVEIGEQFTVRVNGTDDRGLASVWWWGDQTGDSELNQAHWHDCNGTLSCNQSWSASTQTLGILRLCANSRDTAYPTPDEPHQASEGLGIPCAQIEVISAPNACSGVEVSGYCWHLGPHSESCDAVCAAYGGYNVATRTYAGSDGTPSNCQRIIERLQLPLDEFFETFQGGIGCFVIQNTRGNYSGFWDQHPTTASAIYVTPGRQRICACQQ